MENIMKNQIIFSKILFELEDSDYLFLKQEIL